MADSKKLYRLPEKGKLFGVAAGLAEYFEFDVTLVRIILVVMVIAGAGIIIPVYIALALILPTPEGRTKDGNIGETVRSNIDSISQDLKEGETGVRARNYLGAGLIVIGLWILAVRIAPEIFTVRWDLVWPATLVILGILVLTRLGRK